MRILSIGNSFSQDAHKWLSQVAGSCGDEMQAVNLFIGSCYLEKHWNNFVSQSPVYDMQVNGDFVKKIAIDTMLRAQPWDVITFQQASPQCGDYSTYQPYLTDLYRKAKALCPNAKFYIHQTWSYESDCTRPAFDNYGRSQSVMYQQLREAYRKAADSIGAPLIPVGDVIQYLRENVPEFDFAGGGLPLTRDGFHLSELYGRYAAALTWYGVLTGKDVRCTSFIPSINGEQADENLLKKIDEAVYSVLHP